MKFFTAAAVLSAAVSEVSGHYIFQQLSVGSTKYDVFQHIRKNTNYNSPVTGKCPHHSIPRVFFPRPEDTEPPDNKTSPRTICDAMLVVPAVPRLRWST